MVILEAEAGILEEGAVSAPLPVFPSFDTFWDDESVGSAGLALPSLAKRFARIYMSAIGRFP